MQRPSSWPVVFCSPRKDIPSQRSIALSLVGLFSPLLGRVLEIVDDCFGSDPSAQRGSAAHLVLSLSRCVSCNFQGNRFVRLGSIYCLTLSQAAYYKSKVL